jgi:hypothetical protein
MIQIHENMTDEERIKKAKYLQTELEFLTRSQKYYGVDDSITEFEKQLDYKRLDACRFTDDEITRMTNILTLTLEEHPEMKELKEKCDTWIEEMKRFKESRARVASAD